jgi:hypothetical protein
VTVTEYVVTAVVATAVVIFGALSVLGWWWEKYR